MQEFKNRMSYVCLQAMIEEIRYTLYPNRKLTADEAMEAEIEVINNTPDMHIFNLTSSNTKEDAINDVKFYYSNI